MRAGIGAVEIRSTEGGGVRVEGYAAVFNERADIGGMFHEVIAPGAFEGRLGDDVVFQIEHRDLPLARTTSGTLTLSLDARGLKMAADLDPSDPDVARIVPKMKRGDLSKMSFGFSVDRGAEEWDQTGEVPVRTIRKISRLWDVSIVTEPAYSGTEIALRSLEGARLEAEAGLTQAADLRAAALKSRLVDLI